MRSSKTNLSVIDNTGARIQPRIIIGDNAGYKSGDILDANAMMNEVTKEMPDVDDMQEQIDALEEKVEALDDVGIVIVDLVGGISSSEQVGLTASDYDYVISVLKSGKMVFGHIDSVVESHGSSTTFNGSIGGGIVYLNYESSAPVLYYIGSYYQTQQGVLSTKIARIG